MNPIYIRFHRWRSVSLFNPERDLFHHVARLGFVTIYVCKRCLLDAYRRMRCTVADAVAMSDPREGR